VYLPSLSINAGLKVRGSNLEMAKRVYLFQNCPGRLCAHVQSVSGFFPGLKRPQLEAHHSPPSGVEVKNEWISTCVPPVQG
jgi:hypothetical protein